MEYKIYKLICPFDNTVKYIGLTEMSLKERLYSHMTTQYGYGSYDKLLWIRKCQLNKVRPKIELIEIVKTNLIDARNIEKDWILRFKNDGHKLLNSKHFNENKRIGVPLKEYQLMAKKKYKQFVKDMNALEKAF